MIRLIGRKRKGRAWRGIRRYALLCFVIAGFAGGLNAQAAIGQAGAHSKRQLVEPVPGDYLRNEYLQLLRKTRSPLCAGAAATPQLIMVMKSTTGISIGGIYNFHEGGLEIPMAKDGAARGKLDELSEVTVTAVDQHHLKLASAANPPQIYTYVGKAENYVAAVVLVGKYADDGGRSYIFEKDGWAIFPGRRFKYEIGIDHVLTSFDYFWIPPAPTKKEYAFKWAAGKLQLFETHGEPPWGVVDKQPFLVLHPVSSR